MRRLSVGSLSKPRTKDCLNCAEVKLSVRIRKAFHFEKPNLGETACKDVDNMTVVRYSFRKIVIELLV